MQSDLVPDIAEKSVSIDIDNWNVERETELTQLDISQLALLVRYDDAVLNNCLFIQKVLDWLDNCLAFNILWIHFKEVV